MADTIEIIQGTATVVEVAGPTGPQGPAGAAGATGATGPQGVPGTGLEVLTTQGDLLYRGASENQRLPIGSSGQVLKVSGGIPGWANESGAVTSVNGATGAVTITPASIDAANDNHTHDFSDINVNGVLISGAGNADANGSYLYSGDFGDRGAYHKDKDSLIYWDGTAWLINVNGADRYSSTQNVSFPYQVTSWSVLPGTGTAPAPTSNARLSGQEFEEIVGQRINPTLRGTAASKDAPTSGNASSTQVVLGNDTRLSDARTPTSHAASHAVAGSDPLAPSDIGAQSVFVVEQLTITTSAQVNLTAARAKIFDIVQYAGQQVDVKLPTSGSQNADTFVFRWANGSDSIRIINSSSPSPITTVSSGQQVRLIRGTSDNWNVVPVDTHTHPASAISDSTSAGRALLTSADAAAQRTSLGLAASATTDTTNASNISSGTLAAARLSVGTTAGTVAAGDDSRITGAIQSTLVDSKGDLIVATAADTVARLPVGATNGHVLTVDSAEAGGMKWAAASGGGVTGAAASASDVLGVSGANITGVDANADRLIFWDDSASALKHLTVGSGLSLTDTTLTATGGGVTTGSVDNAVLRADGTGGSTSQSSDLVIDDAVVPFNITGDAGTDIITAVGHNFTANQGVRFPTLTGGSGLNTTTNYFVRDISGDTFKVSTTSGGAAVNFTTNITAGTVVAMQANVAIRNNSSETNSTLVLTPKGTGAFIVGPKPDGTATGGNPCGNNAISAVIDRSAATQVASGTHSVAIGYRSTASGLRAVAIGGTSSAQEAFGATGGSASGNGSVSIGGQNGSATNTYAVCIGGYFSTASGFNSVSGGEGCTASASYSANLGGQRSLADRYAMQAHAAGRFAADGDAQRARFVLRCKTTTNAAVEMALDGGTTYLTIPSGKVLYGEISVVGVKSTGADVALYYIRYAAKNVGGTSSEIFSSVTTDNAAGTSLTITTQDTGDYISIKPVGASGETWRWVAKADIVEVAYGT